MRPGKNKPSVMNRQEKVIRKWRTIAGRTIVAPSPRKHKVRLTLSGLFRSTIRLSDPFRRPRLLAVCRMYHTVRIAEEGTASCPPIPQRGCRQFVFCGRADVARSCNHVAKRVAILGAFCEVRIQ